METMQKHFNNIAGGCTFSYILKEILKENNITEAKLSKNWKNNKTVFEIDGEKYIISNRSYIFNYEGFIELEKFDGKTRKISNTITSSYSCLSMYGYGEDDIFIVQ